MTAKKTIRKPNTKPEFIVDITDCKDAYDILCRIAITKYNLDKPLTKEDLTVLLDAATCMIFDTLAEEGVLIREGHNIYIHKFNFVKCPCKYTKKPGFFKRIWHWITGK